jgi:flagellar motility protein MotE (MotC chaperone)
MLKQKPLLSGILIAMFALASPGTSLAQDSQKTDGEPKKTEAAPKRAEAAAKKADAESKKAETEPKRPEAEPKKADSEPKKADAEASDGVQQYCANVASFAAEARIAWQMKRLDELQTQLKQKIADLEAKEAESRDWVLKRQDMMKKAADDIVAIYAKMEPEAAAAQMAVLDEGTAAAVLAKLKPAVSSAILNEMEPGKAAKLTNVMSGLANPSAERKKS